MITVYDIGSCAEQQERASAICAFGLALGEALIADERSLLVANEASQWHTLERPICEIPVNLARRDETR